MEEIQLPLDVDETEESALVEELSAIQEEDRFSDFKTAFYERFVTKKQSYKGKDYYINHCYYQKGKFHLKYVINSTKYQASFSMKELAATDEGKIFWKKVFSLDEKAKKKDQLMQDVKSEIFYYQFDFFIFKAILCRYLFEFKHEKNEKIWDTDFHLFALLQNKDFMSIVNKLDMDKKSSFFGLLN